MKRLEAVLALLALALPACAHAPQLRRHQAGFIMKLLDLKYDRKQLSCVLLVSPKATSATIDDRLVEGIHFVLSSFRDCETGMEVKAWVTDYILMDDLHDHLLQLGSEYWYGAPMKFDLFRDPDPGPPCLEGIANYRPLADPTLGEEAIKFRVVVSGQ